MVKVSQGTPNIPSNEVPDAIVLSSARSSFSGSYISPLFCHIPVKLHIDIGHLLPSINLISEPI